ncbi:MULTISPECIES: signal peptidase I [unclassified Microbacterium]|uniref:signal peptidase I n=1 Tax=unclassified Microbacterium TaxID=2609290 RepID=UPI000EA8A231|nr:MULTISPECIES: signal peptidase I [unclassified Microbacterium]MBT2485008.1 signal peptidase I [Microbacterium sp. ISL-108]RKN67858.1 signal peptidase I [Microbacterium sp. CGR2]
MTIDEASAPRPRRRIGVWVNVSLALLLTVIIVAFVGQPSSGSMSPTLEQGDRLVVNRLAYIGSDPAQGDIVVFRPGQSWGEKPAAGNWFTGAMQWMGEATGIRPYVMVKRVIGAPGQTVECCDAEGAVLVDGEPLHEPYVVSDLRFLSGELDCTSSPLSSRCFAKVTVPEGSYLVLGDSRANSADSVFACRGTETPEANCWRWMTRESVFGKAGPILWPVSRWGGP